MFQTKWIEKTMRSPGNVVTWCILVTITNFLVGGLHLAVHRLD